MTSAEEYAETLESRSYVRYTKPVTDSVVTATTDATRKDGVVRTFPDDEWVLRVESPLAGIDDIDILVFVREGD